MRPRIHLLALPASQTTRAYSLCGFTQATIRMATLLTRLGYDVLLYASEENEALCAELIPVITKAEQVEWLEDIPYQHAGLFNEAGLLWAMANRRIIREIQKRKSPREMILTIGGTSQAPVAAAHPDLLTCEYSIGYISSFAAHRVYESEAWRAWQLGRDQQEDGRHFDAVIPLMFDETEFALAPKEPFVLFVGRLTQKKGLPLACEAAALAGIPLKVIGHGDESLVTHGAEYLGALDWRERNAWMARAQCLLCPTLYFEPFGSVAVESQMSGTACVSTNFGGFVETIAHGVSGYRCSYMGEFVQAIHDCAALDPGAIRRRAVSRYSIDAVAPLYQAYFDRLALLWDQGWNTVTMQAQEVAA